MSTFYSAVDKLRSLYQKDPYILEVEDWLASHGIRVRRNLFKQGQLEYEYFQDEPGVIYYVNDDFWHHVDRLIEINAPKGFTSANKFKRITMLGTKNAYHPIRDLLDSLVWDKRPRLEQLLPRYFGTEDTPLDREIGLRWAMGAVKRIYEPGCKFDFILTIFGDQGLGKSTVFKNLTWDPRTQFRGGFNLQSDTKQLVEATRGIWIVEIAELTGNTPAYQDHIKQMISTEIDGPVRLSYAKDPDSFSRQFVFGATTNNISPLKSPDGSRRFWITKSTGCRARLALLERDQIWAEAVWRYKNEPKWREDDPFPLEGALAKEMERRQEGYAIKTGWEEKIAQFVQRHETQCEKNPDRPKSFTLSDVYSFLNIDLRNQTAQASQHISETLRSLKYMPETTTPGIRSFCKIGLEQPPDQRSVDEFLLDEYEKEWERVDDDLNYVHDWYDREDKPVQITRLEAEKQRLEGLINDLREKLGINPEAEEEEADDYTQYNEDERGNPIPPSEN